MISAAPTRITRTLCTTLVLVMCSAMLLNAEETINLSPSRTRRIDASGKVKKIMVSNPRVADARPSSDGKTVLITALGQGSSEIRIVRSGDDDLIYNLRVRADLSTLAGEIRSLLEDVEGLTVKEVGDKIVLDGKLIIKSDYDRVEKIAAAYNNVILNLTKLDRTELNKFVAQAIQKDVSLPTVRVSVLGDTATLEGMVFDPADAAMALEKAKKHCSKVVSLLKLEEVMIETDVSFIMIEGADEDTSGFNILKTLSLEASVNASDAGASYSVSGNLMARLNILAGEGKAKFLAKPHLSTKSGATARFHSGGEVFFEVSGNTGGSLEKIEHGVILSVKPTLRGQNRVMNEITIEVSVPSAKMKGAFSLDKYETSSTTMCKDGESILISGLSQSLETQFKEKTPLLGDIPVLSLFFSEKSKKSTKKELIVVLTPRPVYPIEARGGAFSDSQRHLLKEQ